MVIVVIIYFILFICFQVFHSSIRSWNICQVWQFCILYVLRLAILIWNWYETRKQFWHTCCVQKLVQLRSCRNKTMLYMAMSWQASLYYTSSSPFHSLSVLTWFFGRLVNTVYWCFEYHVTGSSLTAMLIKVVEAKLNVYFLLSSSTLVLLAWELLEYCEITSPFTHEVEESIRSTWNSWNWEVYCALWSTWALSVRLCTAMVGGYRTAAFKWVHAYRWGSRLRGGYHASRPFPPAPRKKKKKYIRDTLRIYVY